MADDRDQSAMTGDSADDRLGPLLDEFVERFRRGERPALTEYVERAPDLEDEIRELFPALIAMEQAGPEADGDAVGKSGLDSAVAPERLGEFRIIREIGRGGMGIVYEAVQESLGRTVALKVLPGMASVDSQQRQRFQRESRTAAMLHHSNIVPVFGVGEHEGVLFYAMQFIEGRPLDEVLRELRRIRSVAPVNGRSSKQTTDPVTGSIAAAIDSVGAVPTGQRASPEETPDRSVETGSAEPGDVSSLTDPTGQGGQFFRNVARIGRQAADALAYAHERDVLHRDVKPSNLLLDLQGTVWIADFGLARTSDDSLTQPGDLVGTLRYMAPERFQGDCSGQSDVYSLGLTLYELLTLQSAFDETDKPRLIRSVTHDSPAAPREIDARIPRDIETVILKAIAREPMARYQSARDMAGDLQRFLDGRPIVARRTSLAERFVLWARRNPTVAALLSVVAVLVGLLAVGSTIAAYQLAHEQSRTQQNLDRALGAEREARSSERDALLQSYRSLVSRTRAIRRSHRAGRRTEGLDAVRQAAALLQQLDLGAEDRFELRNEAIGCLSLVGLQRSRQWSPDEPGPEFALRCWGCDRDAQRFAYELESGEIVVRRFSDFAEVQRLPGIAPFIHTLGWKRPLIKFSNDGRFLAAYGFVESELGQNLFGFQVWNLSDEKLVMQLATGNSRLGTGRGAFDFSPDSRRFYYTPHFSPMLREVNLSDGSERDLFELPTDASFMATHPDGDLVAIEVRTGSSLESPTSVQCFDLKTGALRQRFDHRSLVTFIGWSDDGRRLLTGTGNGLGFVWDVDRPQAPLVTLQGHEMLIVMLAESGDGNLLLTASLDGSSRLWTAAGQEVLRTESDARSFLNTDRQLAFLRAGRGVELHDVLGNDECRILSLPANARADRMMYSLSFSPDSRLLVVATGHSVCLWDVPSGRLLGEADLAGTRAVAFHTDGQVVAASSDQGVRLLTVAGLKRGMAVEAEELFSLDPELHTGDVTDVGFSADGTSLFSVRHMRWLAVARRDDERESLRLPGQAYVMYGALSHNGRLAACSAPYNSLKGQQTAGVLIYATEDGSEVARLPISEGAVGRIVFSPDDRLLATVEMDRVRLWRTDDWTVAGELRRDERGAGMVRFSPDGTLVAFADRRFIKLFDAGSLTEVARLATPLDYSLQGIMAVGLARGLAFSPDSRLLVARSEDGSVLLWDLQKIRLSLSALGLDW